MADEKQTVEVTTEQQFDAYAIIASDKYRRYRDLLTCLLNEDEMYTESDIDISMSLSVYISSSLRRQVSKSRYRLYLSDAMIA